MSTLKKNSDWLYISPVYHLEISTDLKGELTVGRVTFVDIKKLVRIRKRIGLPIVLSIPRRRYYSDKCNLTICPECGSDLIEESCTILLCAKSDSDEGEFMTNLSGSHFCNKCPFVVFDTDKVEQAATLGIRGDNNLRYIIGGIIDFDSIPDNKKHLEIGCDENPVPLVRFLPD